jgi:hypothetical protein
MKHNAMKTYGRAVSFIFRPLNPAILLDRKIDRLIAGLDAVEKEKISSPCPELATSFLGRSARSSLLYRLSYSGS